MERKIIRKVYKKRLSVFNNKQKHIAIELNFELLKNVSSVMNNVSIFFFQIVSKMWYFIALCVLAVHAENNTDVKVPTRVKVSETVKVEPKNISSLYIGDLLRTKPKDILQAAGSVHRPLTLDEDLLLSASVPDVSLTYKSHGGHEYAGTEYRHLYPESRSNSPTTAVKRLGDQLRSVPVNLRGHILTLKPVRVVAADSTPTSRNPEEFEKTGHYRKDDCKKSSDKSYSSEGKHYPSDEPYYRRAKQTDSSPDAEYRYSPNRHSDEDTYSSRYDSKTYPSNTQSQSAGSYTTSKSSSTSKTINSSKKPSVVPVELSDSQSYEKRPGFAHGNQEEYVVYKTRETPNQRPSGYSENAEREYLRPNYDEKHEPVTQEPQYSQHSSGVRKSRKYALQRPTNYSPESKDRPHQYREQHYSQDQGGYTQNSYEPTEEQQHKQNSYEHIEEQRYKQQNKPTSTYNENAYSHERDTNRPNRKTYSQNPEGVAAYEAEQPSQPYSGKQYTNTHYEKTSNGEREPTAYTTGEQASPEYTYPLQHQRQHSRGRKERPLVSYDSYPPQDTRTESGPTSQPYHSPQAATGPSEKHFRQYAYEATPSGSNSGQDSNRAHRKRTHRESTRSARSPKRAKSVAGEKVGQLPVAGNEQVVVVTKENEPYVSRSQSFSESSYNMGNDKSPKPVARLRQPDQFPETQERQASNPDYQTSYKLFNSEYPASYANDQHHNSGKQRPSRAYERQYETPHPYDGPGHGHSQTQSHSGEAPQQYQPYQDEPYDQETDDASSHEQGGTQIKKNKNHHYISNIEGYKDSYGPDEPLVIDEEFFKKYGISHTAKVIVANAENPNLFVADGSNIKEGEFFGNSGPSSGHNSGPSSGASSGPSSGGGYGPNSGPSSVASDEESYEPNYKTGYKEDAYVDSPEEQEPQKQLPGSFHELVDTDPKFLRKLPQLLKGDDVFFKMDSSEASFDDAEFPKVNEQRGYIVSQGPREIVQQHGDGMSRIIFNIPRREDNAETAYVDEVHEEQNKEQIQKADSEVAKKVVQPDS